MRAEDRLPINFRRVSSRANDRRFSELRAMAVAGRNRDSRCQSESDDISSTSTRHPSLRKLENTLSNSNLESRRHKPSPMICCVERWKYHQKSIRKYVRVLLVLIAIFKMICGMVFAAIHVVLTFSSAQLTNELQNPLPIYLSAAMVALSGLCDMVLTRIKTPYMILTGIFFSISSCVITLAGLLSAATVSLPKFTSFIKFQYDHKLQSCTAYTQWDMQANGTFTGGITYDKISGCSLIESTLPPITLTLVTFYAIACFTSFVACFLLTILLCLPDNNRKLSRMESKESSYINYDLELDNICDIGPWIDESRAKSRGTLRGGNEGYLPGITSTCYTLPYRLPLNTVGISTGEGTGRELNLSQTHSTDTLCGCSSGPVVSSVVSQNYSRPRTALSATVGRHKENRRPIIPLEFRGITRLKAAEDQERLAASDRESGVLHFDACGVVERPAFVRMARAEQCQANLPTHQTERQKIAIGKVGDIGRFPKNNNRKETSFGTNGESYSPPPYSELPDYGSRTNADTEILTDATNTQEDIGEVSGCHFAGETIL